MVLEHDDGLELSLVSCLHEVRVTYNLDRLLDIEVRVLEQASAEAVHEKPFSRLFESCPCAFLTEILHPHLVSLEDGSLVIVSTELVDTCLDDLVVTFGFSESLIAPALALESFHMEVILGYVPVSTYYTVKSVFLTEKVGNDILGVAVTVLFSGRILVVGDGIVRHDCGSGLGLSFEVECTLNERPDLSSQIVARVDGIFTVAVVAVTSTLFGTAAGPVFDHGVDTLESPAVFYFSITFRCLESVHISPCHIYIKVRILTESTVETAPAGFSSKVNLR